MRLEGFGGGGSPNDEAVGALARPWSNTWCPHAGSRVTHRMLGRPLILDPTDWCERSGGPTTGNRDSFIIQNRRMYLLNLRT
jgi:hypothetical protein